jgi:hypothetical protein
MADQFTEVTTKGWGKRIMDSFLGVLIGLALFLISFVVLWKTEGRTNYAKIAAQAAEVSASKVEAGAEGRLVSVTAPLETPDSLGDAGFLKPGTYIALERRVEMFAWVEHKESKTERKTGGSEVTTTTYTYKKEWTDDPEPASEFKHPEGHENPTLEVEGKGFKAGRADVGAYSVDPEGISLPSPSELELAPGKLDLPKRSDYELSGNFLFKGYGTMADPEVGDVRISYRALPSGRKVTAFGKLSGSALEPYLHKGEKRLYRAISGTRDEAIQQMKTEYKVMGWAGRIVGFLMMWIGLLMMTGPLSTILDVLPFLGSASRFVIGLLTFPIALVLSLITIIISMIAHNAIALIIVLALILGGGFLLYNRKRAAPAAPPAK